MAAVDLDLNALFAGQSSTENNGRKNFWYKLDDGTYVPIYGLNTNQANLFGFAPTLPSGGVISTSKRLVRPRSISFTDTTGKIKGEFHVGTPLVDIYISGGTVKVPRKGKADGVIVRIIGTQGEKTRFADPNVSSDSGQIDIA